MPSLLYQHIKGKHFNGLVTDKDKRDCEREAREIGADVLIVYNYGVTACIASQYAKEELKTR